MCIRDSGGIINSTDDAALGNDAIIDSTLDAVKTKANDAVNQAKEEGLWDKICLLYTSIECR